MSAVSQGAHEKGGRVVGLPMRHWKHLEPNQWSAELRWADGYGARLEHLLRCSAVVALPGGVGTLAELSVVWSAAQTEARPPQILLLGDCWPPIIDAIGRYLVVGPDDLRLLRVVGSPAAVIEALSGPIEHVRRRGAHG
jgi:predicted Rossmann-fold nucleotide-binding protein